MKRQWNEVNISKSGNQPLLNATMHHVEPEYNEVTANSADTDFTVTVLCAVYDEDNVFIGIQYKTIRVPADNTKDVTFDSIITDGTAKYKVLLWDNISFMNAAGGAVEKAV